MQTVRNKGIDLNSKALESFLGTEARMEDRLNLPVNKHVQAELLSVFLPENEQREDEACMYLFPIDDASFCVQLLYLVPDETVANNASVFFVEFLPAFFDQYSPEVLMANMPFRFDQSTEMEFPVCSQTRLLLAQLMDSSPMPALIGSLKLTETVMHLLRRALQCATQERTLECHVPTCRFLVYESEREKVMEALNIIGQRLDKPFTIRELSRKVAMNECYLKKGFKALTGKTINDYQQELRITKAKELLQLNGQSVSYVAATLGYSSISHFSTAFKKATGLKPCELLA